MLLGDKEMTILYRTKHNEQYTASINGNLGYLWKTIGLFRMKLHLLEDINPAL